MPVWLAGGEIESYISAAKLFINHKHTPVGYCFATFKESKKPFIKAKGVWNPFIDVNKVVTNDFTIGDKTPQNWVVTGPNGCGKSISIGSLMLALLMAQTYGIAPAKSFEFTPFHLLNCYLNVTDNTGKFSKFEMEVKCAQELIRALNSLPYGTFAFTIMDEILTSTSDEAIDLTKRLVRQLGERNNSSIVFATHVKKVTDLEKETKQWRNMHLEAIVTEKTPDGKVAGIKKTFKLKPGAEFLNIAEYLLEQAGVLQAEGPRW